MASYFVDAQGGNDTTGDGSIGSPWKTIQHALDNTTLSLTDPHQFNLKGTFNTTAQLDFATHGTPSPIGRTTFRGYGTGENDGVRATVASDGTFAITFGASNGGSYTNLIDLAIDCGGSTGVTGFVATASNYIRNCRFTNANRASVNYQFYSSNLLVNCELIADDGWGCYLSGGHNRMFGCYVETPGDGIRWGSSSSSCVVEGNCVVTTGTSSSGLVMSARNQLVRHNSILSTVASTADGIYNGSYWYGDNNVCDNLIEGWSGTGGQAIYLNDAADNGHHAQSSVVSNSWYNCDLGLTVKNGSLVENNESLIASPFAKTGSRDFGNRYTYFAPVGVGKVINGASLSFGVLRNRGAVQTEELAPSRHPLARF